MLGKLIRRRGAVAVALGTVAALALSACSIGSGGGGTASNEFTFGTVPSAKATVTVWSFLPGNYDKGKEAYAKVIADFEAKYPQVTVDLVNMPYPTYFDQVRNATVAQKGPDVVTMYGGAQAYSYKNGLYPLQNAMAPDVKANLNFVDDNYSKDGNLYILPTGTYGYALMVNKSLFDKAGIDPTTGLSSWSNLLSSCQALWAKGIQPVSAAWKDGYLFETFMYMISSQMMDTATLKKWVSGAIPVDDPMFVQATNYILDMNKANCFGDSTKTLGLSLYDDGFNAYYAGNAAMMATGSLATAQKSYDSVPSSTIMPLPQVPASKFTSMIDAGAEGGWSVTKWTKNPQASLAFVNFLASPAAQQTLWDMVGVPPNLKNLQVQGTTPSQNAYLPILENPNNHTGFAAFPLSVLAVYERNAGSLIGGTMDEKTFTEQAQSAFAKSK